MTTSTLQHNDNKSVEVENRVIKKLFRRLITFLFVLFVFSFLDRINIGFAGLTMGKDLGLTSTMFGLAATLFSVRIDRVPPFFPPAIFLVMNTIGILVFGGIQLLMLGLIGEYLGRLFMMQKGKPQYVVRTKLDQGS